MSAKNEHVSEFLNSWLPLELRRTRAHTHTGCCCRSPSHNPAPCPATTRECTVRSAFAEECLTVTWRGESDRGSDIGKERDTGDGCCCKAVKDSSNVA